ncbi:acyl-CoA dehydrogenase [Nocardioides anomalus]|uniref:Acyl-CoA dehydrogenase n=1 Tax=Nocardioides anomalus TaxID=2712223 RepID=A0A6G6WEV4_9ACTN|nr:acyl-CoA dehydrogenase family protein [Nocardioides anomalus]QIG43736.1 acyl-CoA dehydrogenase [Nocardioides anomalus]
MSSAPRSQDASSEEERRALREASRRLLVSHTPQSADEHGAATAAAPDRQAWTALAEQLGLLGVRVPEELGGVGLGLAEELLVHEEAGRALHGGPFLPVLAQTVPALVRHAPDRLEAVLAGVEVVVPACTAWYRPDAAPLVLDRSGRVSGTVPSVLEPVGADRLLVVAERDGAPVLGLVDAASTTMTRLTGVDLTRRFADVRLDDVPLDELARGDDAHEAVTALESDGALALCADAVGAASAAFAMSVDYLTVREQFGQVIGAFQGLKHQAADLLVLLESARSALAFAADARQGDDEGLARAALAVARRRCGSAAFRITNEAIHLHGGIGFTWEHRVHLHHRRAKTDEVLLDAQGAQARVLADAVFGLYAAQG